MKLTIFFLILMVIILVTTLFIKHKEYIKKITYLKGEIQTLSSSHYYWRNQCEFLQDHIKKLEIRYESLHDNINSGVLLEAVKKAMYYSHPDKGNCDTSDDFIKFKILYDKLRNR